MRNQREQGGKSNRRYHQNAWAPYNFVPLPKSPLYAKVDNQGIPQSHDTYVSDKHTGYFDVTLTTETPLFVRGMLTIEEQKAEIEIRKKPESFSVDNQVPIIPGSSLRGMIRTLVEIVTNSKMHFVSDNKLVYRSVFGNDALARDYRGVITDIINDKEFVYPSQQMHGGYLRKGASQSGWVIQPAKVHRGESIVLVNRKELRTIGISEAETRKTYPVYVRPVSRTKIVGKQGVRLHIAQADGIAKQIGNGYQAATLIIASTVGDKEKNRHWHPAIYQEDLDSNPIPISENIWDDFLKDRELNRGIPNRYLEEGSVLFYLLNHQGELVFFGPTMFFRIPYKNSVGQLIPNSLRQRNPALDYAEAMFGYVSEQGEERTLSAYTGRISITSAHVTENQTNYYDETIIPKILSSPKPTTFQHYLEQPEGWQTQPHQLRHYGDNSKIRGHKLYWRQKIDNLDAVKDPDQSPNLEERSQYTRITPVRQGIEFRFKVYFENLSDEELGALAWVLTLGGDSQARHQLGMGKPLGLGVVKLDSKLILTSRKERYAKLFEENGRWFTGETFVDEAHQAQFVDAFKHQIDNFDDQEHIRELKVLLQLQETDVRKFSYMQIEAKDKQTKQNDYQGRPVLPRPSEIGD